MRPARAALIALLLSLIGAGIAGYLTYLHFGLLRGEFLGGPACSGTGLLNCHAVTAGSWGHFIGMPLALWGMIGYLAVFALAVLAEAVPEFAPGAMALIFLLASVFVVADAGLLFLMVRVIRLYCLFCLATYAVNLALLACAWRALAPPRLAQLGPALAALSPRNHPIAPAFWGMMLLGVAGVAALHATSLFLVQGPAGSLKKQLREFVQRQPRVSPDLADQPALGPDAAPLVLVEFSDFFCPSCQRAFQMNSVILPNHRQDVRFIFKHYPLDTACNEKLPHSMHPGACQAAAAAECAYRQGRFWPVHDFIFQQTSTSPQHQYPLANLDADMAKLGLDVPRFRACMDSGEGMEAVKRDIADGQKLGVASTPTFYLNGLPVVGGVNPPTFEALVAVLREQS